MTKTQKSTALYPHPFSKAYWKDAAAELKSIKMLVVTALMIALRVALKPLAIPLGPQLSIQTAMLATPGCHDLRTCGCHSRRYGLRHHRLYDLPHR